MEVQFAIELAVGYNTSSVCLANNHIEFVKLKPIKSMPNQLFPVPACILPMDIQVTVSELL